MLITVVEAGSSVGGLKLPGTSVRVLTLSLKLPATSVGGLQLLATKLMTVVEAGAAGVAQALQHRTKAPPDGGSATATASASAAASATPIFATGS